MRNPTREEVELLERRRALFARFEAESVPALVELGGVLGAAPPEALMSAPDTFVPVVERMLANEDLSTIAVADRVWLQSRLTWFVGQIFLRRHRGRWLVQEDPDSRYFAQFLVGRFTEGTSGVAAVNPAEVVQAYLNQDPGRRSLATLLSEVETDLARAPEP